MDCIHHLAKVLQRDRRFIAIQVLVARNTLTLNCIKRMLKCFPFSRILFSYNNAKPIIIAQQCIAIELDLLISGAENSRRSDHGCLYQNS